MRVIGIDPGIAIMGVGVIDADGPDLRLVEYTALTTSAKSYLPDRLLTLHDGLRDIIARLKPDAASVEQLYFNTNVSTAFSVGQARGVALIALAEAGVPMHEYTPLQVKQAVVSYGRATKHQVGEMIRMLLNLDHVPTPDDAADALAIAICHVNSSQFERLAGGR